MHKTKKRQNCNSCIKKCSFRQYKTAILSTRPQNLTSALNFPFAPHPMGTLQPPAGRCGERLFSSSKTTRVTRTCVRGERPAPADAPLRPVASVSPSLSVLPLAPVSSPRLILILHGHKARDTSTTGSRCVRPSAKTGCPWAASSDQTVLVLGKGGGVKRTRIRRACNHPPPPSDDQKTSLHTQSTAIREI